MKCGAETGGARRGGGAGATTKTFMLGASSAYPQHCDTSSVPWACAHSCADACLAWCVCSYVVGFEWFAPACAVQVGPSGALASPASGQLSFYSQ